MQGDIGTKEGAVWVGVGILVGVLALRLELGSFHAPGPGFVAFLTALFIGAMGLIMILAGVMRKRRSGRTTSTGAVFSLGSWRRLLYTLGLLLAYIILLEPVGFVVMTFLVMFGLYFDYDRRNWGRSLFFAAAASLVSYGMFETWLHCQLPKGIFPWG